MLYAATRGRFRGDLLDGGPATTSLYGGWGWDTLKGGDGNDYITGGDPDVFGGNGNDMIEVAGSGPSMAMPGRRHLALRIWHGLWRCRQ